MLARWCRKSMDSFLERPAAPNWQATVDRIAVGTAAVVDKIVADIAVADIVVDAAVVRRLVVDRVAAVVAKRKPGWTLEVESTGIQGPDECG